VFSAIGTFVPERRDVARRGKRQAPDQSPHIYPARAGFGRALLRFAGTKYAKDGELL
jgi:hypothetical protein